MVILSKLHKTIAWVVIPFLLILSISGFFLNHKSWNFLYTLTFSHLPQSTLKNEEKLFESFWIDPLDRTHVIVAGKRGIFESRDSGLSYQTLFNGQVNSLRVVDGRMYAATSQGLLSGSLGSSQLSLLGLGGENVTSLSLDEQKIFAAVDKSEVILFDINGTLLKRTQVHIDPGALEHEISLGRLIRDLHYGRGLFDGISSLIINDYGTLALIFLAVSGLMLSIFIYQTRHKRVNRSVGMRRILRVHASILAIAASIPLIILAVTGIFLDHSKLFTNVMKEVKISPSLQPPVYQRLTADIWSVDISSEGYRIGNRHGIYKSRDLSKWSFENKGLAYRMKREENGLYVSGMGAPSRMLDHDGWHKLSSAPHMFRDVQFLEGKEIYLGGHCCAALLLPQFHDATLYSLLFTLHDGSFFSEWWVYANDFAAIALVLLLGSGTILWLRMKRYI